ncbi:hypothetical protein FBU31_000431 [Coemansia sp. 'formosensis']|nr:hypothetical protein FBU31_000431 [Coemansia sp. 'formosensis']
MSDVSLHNRIWDLEIHLAIQAGSYTQLGLPMGMEHYVPAAMKQPHLSAPLDPGVHKDIIDSFLTIAGLIYDSPPMPTVLRELPRNLADQDKLLHNLCSHFADVLCPLLKLVCSLPEAVASEGFPVLDTYHFLEGSLLLLHDSLSHIDELHCNAIITHLGGTPSNPGPQVDPLVDVATLLSQVSTEQALRQQVQTLAGSSSGKGPHKKGKRSVGKGKQSAPAVPAANPTTSDLLQSDAPASTPHTSDTSGGGSGDSSQCSCSCSQPPNGCS